MSADRHASVALIGAGISGLSTAYFLTRRGIDVRIIEKSERAGGTIESQMVDGFLVDYGPNSGLETTPLLGDLFDGVGVRTDLQYASSKAKNRYIVKNGELHALPTGPRDFFKTPLFSTRAKLRLLGEPFVRRGDPKHDESIADFVRRRLGPEFLDYAINPFVSGVYAGSPDRLSVRSSFPKLYELEQRHGSLIKGAVQGMRERRKRRKRGEKSRAAAPMFSFAGGMQTLIDALSMTLGNRIHMGTRPLCIEQKEDGFAVHVRSASGDWMLSCDALVLAIPAYAYKEFDFTMEFSIGERLGAVTYPPVSVVFFGYRSNPSKIPLDGFGFLVPEREKRGILGTIWSSTLFPDRAPDGGVSLTTFVGGSRQPETGRLAEGALVDRVRSDLRTLLGIGAAPDVVAVRRWGKAIPQYNLGHVELIREIEALEVRHPGLFVSGNFRGGVSIGDCVIQAHTTSERVAAGLPAK